MTTYEYVDRNGESHEIELSPTQEAGLAFVSRYGPMVPYAAVEELSRVNTRTIDELLKSSKAAFISYSDGYRVVCPIARVRDSKGRWVYGITEVGEALVDQIDLEPADINAGAGAWEE